MKFSGKMSVMIILKVRKSQASTLSLEETFLGKLQGCGGGGGVKLSPQAFLGLIKRCDANAKDVSILF